MNRKIVINIKLFIKNFFHKLYRYCYFVISRMGDVGWGIKYW